MKSIVSVVVFIENVSQRDPEWRDEVILDVLDRTTFVIYEFGVALPGPPRFDVEADKTADTLRVTILQDCKFPPGWTKDDHNDLVTHMSRARAEAMR